jgi:pyruvate dehydrogenase E1 component beta subunit
MANVVATGRCVIVHEAPLSAGFGAEVIATIQEEAFYDLQAPIVRVSAPDTPYPVSGVEHFYLPNIARVKNAVRRTVEALA